jgi:hypothetical protein
MFQGMYSSTIFFRVRRGTTLLFSFGEDTRIGFLGEPASQGPRNQSCSTLADISTFEFFAWHFSSTDLLKVQAAKNASINIES